MPTEVNKEIELEIAYVLFIDIVGYSKLVTAEQRLLLELLNRIVREAEHFRTAEANGRLITEQSGLLQIQSLRATGVMSDHNARTRSRRFQLALVANSRRA